MTDKKREKQQSFKWPLVISAILLGGTIVAYFLIPSVKAELQEAFEVLTSENRLQIKEWVDQFGPWGPIAIYLGFIMQMFIFIIPSVGLMIVSSLAYGPFWGAVISFTGILLASTIAYFIGRSLGEVAIHRLVGDKSANKVEYLVEKYGFWAVIVTRISPFLSNDAISFVSGILKLSYWKFILATSAGILPLVVLISYLGEDNDRLKNGLIWISAVSLVAFIIYIIYDRSKTKKIERE